MLFKKESKLTVGQDAEKQAERFLSNQGLKILCRNYRCKYGEVDLIMEDRGTITFVEVRKRSNKNYGGPLATVDFKKQKKIQTTAQVYMSQKQWLNSKPMRFDVIGVIDKDINWIKGAF